MASVAPGTNHVEVESVQRLLDAIVSIGSELSLPTVLRRIVGAAVELADSRYGALGVIDPATGTLSDFITVGLDDDTRRAIGDEPKGHGILGLLIAEPFAIRLPHLAEHEASFGFPPDHPPMDRFLGVPIRVRGTVFGNLYLCDKADGSEFTQSDEELVSALAVTAGVAIESARLHARVGELLLVEDRERIARDLHDTVIQRIFATGLVLSGIAARLDDPPLSERLQSAVDDLDDTVRHIRTTIFELSQPRLPGRSLRQEILDLAVETGEASGVEPSVSFDGPVDIVIGPDVAENLLATLREALTNAVKHAHTERIEVLVQTRNGLLTLVVLDEGVGLPATLRTEGRGLHNLRTRAEQLGGTMIIETRQTGGTALTWQVPLGD
jgi:signal transduction histidine kinase